MSPKQPITVPDSRSEIASSRVGRPPFPRQVVLTAADALFADNDSPRSVSMDDIAAAAGVGKGTLFRAFGSRDGLLDALFATRLSTLRSAIDSTDPRLGSAARPLDRVLAIVDEVLTFKFDNHHLIAARELAGSGLLQSPHYRWMHALLMTMIEQIGASKAGRAGFVSHVVLGALRADLLDQLLAEGRSQADVRRDVRSLVSQLLEPW